MCSRKCDITSAFSAGRPDPPLDLDLSDLAARSVRLTWIPGNERRSPVTRQYRACVMYSRVERCVSYLWDRTPRSATP